MTNLQIKILNIIDTYNRPLSVRKILSLLQTTHQNNPLNDHTSIPTLSDVSIALKKLRQNKQVDECRRAVYQRVKIDQASISSYEHPSSPNPSCTSLLHGHS